MVSLKDIAQRCGVSTATVSKALHDQKDIGAETKNRIKKIAKEMGYLPNAAARVLKTNESNNIGVLYFDEAAMGLTHEYFAGVLNGIKAQAEMLGYDITFINTSPVGKKLSYLEHCKYRNFDGVVIVCARFQDNEVQELMSSDIPVVTIDYVHYSCSAVSSNNVKCMGELLDYIISMGHKKIAYIHGQDFSSVTRDRLAAYYRALEKHGIDIPEAGCPASQQVTPGSGPLTWPYFVMTIPPSTRPSTASAAWAICHAALPAATRNTRPCG